MDSQLSSSFHFHCYPTCLKSNGISSLLVKQTSAYVFYTCGKILQCKMLDLVKHMCSPPTYEKNCGLTMIQTNSSILPSLGSISMALVNLNQCVSTQFVVQQVHPGRLTWNLQITHLERKMIFQTSMIVFHVNLPGCRSLCLFYSNCLYL